MNYNERSMNDQKNSKEYKDTYDHISLSENAGTLSSSSSSSSLSLSSSALSMNSPQKKLTTSHDERKKPLYRNRTFVSHLQTAEEIEKRHRFQRNLMLSQHFVLNASENSDSEHQKLFRNASVRVKRLKDAIDAPLKRHVGSLREISNRVQMKAVRNVVNDLSNRLVMPGFFVNDEVERKREEGNFIFLFVLTVLIFLYKYYIKYN